VFQIFLSLQVYWSFEAKQLLRIDHQSDRVTNQERYNQVIRCNTIRCGHRSINSESGMRSPPFFLIFANGRIGTQKIPCFNDSLDSISLPISRTGPFLFGLRRPSFHSSSIFFSHQPHQPHQPRHFISFTASIIFSVYRSC
jgi:hypothetical protein